MHEATTHLELWQSIPFAMILLPLGSAAITSALKTKWARRWAITVELIMLALSVAFIVLMNGYNASYTYMMGHYPAPWGNEIRAGILEAITAHFFILIMLLSVLGGMKKLEKHVFKDRQNLYFVMISRKTYAVKMSLVYTCAISAAVSSIIMT